MSTTSPLIVRDGEGIQYSKLADWINDLTEAGTRKITSQRSVVAEDLQSNHPRMPSQGNQDALLVLLPLLIVLSTFLFLLLLFLVCVLLLRKRRGILLRDNDGPVDMGRQELIDGEGGFEGVETRWLESVDEETRRAYLKAKGKMTSGRMIAVYLSITIMSRLPDSDSSQFHAHRYHSFPVLGHTRERSICLVL